MYNGAIKPPYQKQQKSTTCSLAVLRMVLATNDIEVSEQELIRKVEQDYGKRFKNIWNPTIAKLAAQYNIKTTLIADWPLLKPQNLRKAKKEYFADPDKFNYKKYENPDDTDSLPEPLPLAYKELFNALQSGAKATYTVLDRETIEKTLQSDFLMLLSVNLQKLYSDKRGYHSILLYDFQTDQVSYHDPSYGEEQSVSFSRLLEASINVGAAMIFKTQLPKGL